MMTAVETIAVLTCGAAHCRCERATVRGQGLVHCPAHPGDRSPSLSVSEKDGKLLVHCFAGCDPSQVLRSLRGAAAIAPAPPKLRRRPRRAGRPRRTIYGIADVDGRLAAEHIRWDYPDGSKDFAWRRGGRWGLSGLRPEDLPLYLVSNVRRRPSMPVIVTEGEKAALAIQTCSALAVGTVCGAAVTPAQKSLQPLAGREVILWPDNDSAGRAHMAAIAERLKALRCRVRTLNWSGAPEHGDAADFVRLLGAPALSAFLQSEVQAASERPSFLSRW